MPVDLSWGATGTREPVHIAVRGGDGRASNLAGYAVAASLDPEFALLEIRPTAGAPTDGEIPWGELVPAERHLVSFAPAADPSGGGFDPQTDWPIVRADRPGEALSHLLEFLTTPEASEQTLRRRFPLRHPMPVLIANGWIVAQRFPDVPEVTARLMQVQKQFGVSVILVTDPTPRRDMGVFDVVFDVLVSEQGWESTRLRCARAPGGAGPRAGDEIRLGELKGFAPSLGRLGAELGAAVPPDPNGPSPAATGNSPPPPSGS